MRCWFLAIMMVISAGAAAEEPRKYLYDVTGKALNGAPYQGRAVISVSSTGCRMAWRTPEFSRGTCMFTDDGLVASYRLGRFTGLVAYKRKGKSDLEGVWSVEGQAGKGNETLIFRQEVSDERKALSGAYDNAAPAAPLMPNDDALFEEALGIVSAFLKPGADHARLTLALKPSDADVRAVFSTPFANAAIKLYDEAYAKAAEDPVRRTRGRMMSGFRSRIRAACSRARMASRRAMPVFCPISLPMCR